MSDPTLDTITLERDGQVLLIGLNRPEKRNAFNRAMLADLSLAYGLLERDDELRAGVLFAHGDHFTTGLDLADVAPAFATGENLIADGGADPLRLAGRWTTPVVAAAHGTTMTIGIELLLAADIRVASADARFSQLEVRRGIYPVGGATLRFPREAGWGNAMRWMLTGESFDATEAHRIGVVQELAADAAGALSRAQAIAQSIATGAAPLAVRATIESAHQARDAGDDVAAAALVPRLQGLFQTADVAEGIQSFVERRDAVFTGR